MENILNKIANIQLQISNELSPEQTELLEKYWEFDEDFKLINQPSKLRIAVGISQKDLNDLVLEYSTMSFYLLCSDCNSMEIQHPKSQTQFRLYTSKIRKSSYRFKCSHCHTLFQEKHEQEKLHQEELRKERLKEKIRDSNTAIDKKVWLNLSGFENGVLKHAIQLNSLAELKKHYYGKGLVAYKKLFSALRILEAENLVFLIMNNWNRNYIDDYQFLSRLNDEYDYVHGNEHKSKIGSSVQFDNESKEIKFKLTVNKNQVHPDSPTHAGTVTFKERIIIEPGEEYIFGFWNRSNDDLYLSMTPLDKMGKLPIQKRLHSLPIPIRKGVEDFLNSIGKGLWLE